MSKPLILRAKECRDKQWREPTDLSHLQNKPLIPLYAAELAKAATTMPVALVKQDKQWGLVGVCGVAPKKNLLIEDGQWLGSYFPAFLSSYPFELVVVGGAGYVTFDRESQLLVQSGGQPFFNENGDFSDSVAKRVELLKSNHRKRATTQKAIDALVSANVLMPWPDALCKHVDMKIEGLHMVDERALAELDDSRFLKLRRAHALAVAYAVNISVFQTRALRKRAEQPDSAAGIPADNAIQSTGDIDVEFLNDTETIKFGSLK